MRIAVERDTVQKQLHKDSERPFAVSAGIFPPTLHNSTRRVFGIKCFVSWLGGVICPFRWRVVRILKGCLTIIGEREKKKKRFRWAFEGSSSLFGHVRVAAVEFIEVITFIQMLRDHKLEEEINKLLLIF
jgi:hypothetical protein